MIDLDTYVLDQCPLVLECVTLGRLIQLMVEMFVDLSCSSVLDKKSSKNSQLSHPQNLTVTLLECHLMKAHPISYLGILASDVPFLLPKPLCLPSLRAKFNALALDRECMATGFRMMRPSLTNFRMVCRELAFWISLLSEGSSQIFRSPQPMTEAARRFCVRRLTL